MTIGDIFHKLAYIHVHRRLLDTQRYVLVTLCNVCAIWWDENRSKYRW